MVRNRPGTDARPANATRAAAPGTGPGAIAPGTAPAGAVAARPGAARRTTPAGGASVAHPAARLAGASAGFAVLLVLTWAGLVLTEAGQRLENLGLAGSTLREGAARADSLTGLGLVSVVTFGVAIAAAAAIALLRRRPVLAVAVVVAMGGSVVLAEVLKELLPRPALVDGPAWLLRNSFPSGTATVAAAVGAGYLVAAPGRLRWIALPVAAGLAAVIGQATQVTGWHRASDALGGALLVLAVTCAVLSVVAATGYAHADGSAGVHPRIHRLLAVVGGLTVLLGVVLVVLVVLLPLLEAPGDDIAAVAHLALGLAAAGSTLLAFGAFGRVLEPLAFGHRHAGDTVEAAAAGGATTMGR